ncbi:hypothetical protein [Clostridium cylindrosporum]|uniref:Uncharacterized protein n=1 Tax=Clostridium cylindrosporum DSM 605 TaxID=1121307 RepID=A0A0J8DBB6_CLOCY|nr:hypothetical protein [Clostridium cylindrosporum]KMT21578.1 hypothetical protein CLCY_2c03400 [Clostridium cylindrosporum DSM 605]
MFIDGKVYADRYNRLYFCERGCLFTSTGFKYEVKDENDFVLTRFTKAQMMELLEDKRKARLKY